MSGLDGVCAGFGLVSVVGEDYDGHYRVSGKRR